VASNTYTAARIVYGAQPQTGKVQAILILLFQ
jgi:hypothetical protein